MFFFFNDFNFLSLSSSIYSFWPPYFGFCKGVELDHVKPNLVHKFFHI
jgi:hypothetical protein